MPYESADGVECTFGLWPEVRSLRFVGKDFFDLARWHRTVEKVALNLVAARIRDRGQLRTGFDTFRHAAHV